MAGTDVQPQFDTAAVVAWLLTHDKIAVPTAEPTGTLVLAAGARGTRRFRLDDPNLTLADDAAGEDRLTAWLTDDDAEAVTAFTAGAVGASVHRLTVPGRTPLAVLGGVQVVDRSIASSGWQRVTFAWRAGLRGAVGGTAGGVVRHGDAVAPAMEWHPGGGLRCTALAGCS